MYYFKKLQAGFKKRFKKFVHKLRGTNYYFFLNMNKLGLSHVLKIKNLTKKCIGFKMTKVIKSNIAVVYNFLIYPYKKKLKSLNI